MKTSIIGILVFILIGCITKLITYMKKERLHECVAWSVTKDSKAYRGNLDLIDYVHKEQLRLKLDSQYKINVWDHEAEYKEAKEILSEYQNYLSQKYFRGELAPLKISSKANEQDYFWMELLDYLSAVDENYSLQTKSLRSGGALTEYGFLFTRLRYLAMLAAQDRNVVTVFEWGFRSVKQELDEYISE